MIMSTERRSPSEGGLSDRVVPGRGVHRVGVAVIEGTNPFEMGAATEVFGLHRPELPGVPYELEICGPGPVTMRQGFFTLTPTAPLSRLVEMDTVIVPGHPNPEAAAPPELIAVLRAAHARGARIVSFCSGSIVLAETGLLDGRRATTHWRYVDRLRCFDDVEVLPDVLYVEDDGVFTAAGSAAALDLSLHLVRLDKGEDAVNIVARRLVFAAHRSGDQRQFFDPPTSKTTNTAPDLSAVQAYAHDRLDQPLTVAQLAAVAGTSVTTFHRWFKAATGQTPQRWLIEQRLARSRTLLETTSDRIDVVAATSGMGTAANLRLHFQRRLGTTPSAYRAAFRSSVPA